MRRAASSSASTGSRRRCEGPFALGALPFAAGRGAQRRLGRLAILISRQMEPAKRLEILDTGTKHEHNDVAWMDACR